MDNEQPPSRPPRKYRRPVLWLIGLLVVVLGWLAYNQLVSRRETPPEGATAPAGGLSVNVSEGQTFTDPVLNLAGSAPPDQLIFINGQPIPVGSDGAFELTLQLAEGPNLILIEARDENGAVTSLIRQVYYSQPEAQAPSTEREFEIPAGLIALALGIFLLGAFSLIIRRRRPWVNLTTDRPSFSLGPKGGGDALTIILELDRTTRVSLYILDESGSTISTLLNNRRREAGRYTFTFDGYQAGSRLPPGPYKARVEAGLPLFKKTAQTSFRIEEPVSY